jgi:hypothetical protein
MRPQNGFMGLAKAAKKPKASKTGIFILRRLRRLRETPSSRLAMRHRLVTLARLRDWRLSQSDIPRPPGPSGCLDKSAVHKDLPPFQPAVCAGIFDALSWAQL